MYLTPGLHSFAADLDHERQRQDYKFGPQDHANGTGRPGDLENADRMRAICQANSSDKRNWRDILAEEITEAFAESDPQLLEMELIQCAAVIQHWVYRLRERRYWGDGGS